MEEQGTSKPTAPGSSPGRCAKGCMLLVSYETDDDYVLNVYDSLYSCYGLEIISPERDRLVFKDCLCLDTAGWSHVRNEPWTVSEWQSWLRGEARSLIEEHCTHCAECDEYKPNYYASYVKCPDCGEAL